MTIWICLGLFLLLCVGILFSSIRIETIYQKKGDQDEAEIVFYALGHLIRYRKKISQVIWKGIDDGVQVKSTETDKQKEEETLITKKKIDQFIEIQRVLVHHIDHFYQTIRRFLEKVTCEKFVWYTGIGTGDAPDTGTLVGVAWGLKTTMVSMIGRRIRWKELPDLQVEPFFVEATFRMQFHSIIRFRLGHAIFAINRLLFYLLMQRRKKSWQNIQFKA